MVTKTFHITAETGIHARPATILVQAASKFKSQVELEYKGKKVNLKSIMAVMSLGAGKGAEVVLYATGEDENIVIDAITIAMEKEGLIA